MNFKLGKRVNRRFFLFVATASASPSMATNATPGFTHGELNGYGWLALTAAQRSVYARGLLEGCAFATKQLEPILDAKAFQVAKIRRLLETANRYSVGIIADQVDIFYSDKTNLLIPIIDACNLSCKFLVEGDGPFYRTALESARRDAEQ